MHGCIVTIDAMGGQRKIAQRKIAQRILESGADYVLAVRENQGQLYESIRDLFEGAEALSLTGHPTTLPTH